MDPSSSDLQIRNAQQNLEQGLKDEHATVVGAKSGDAVFQQWQKREEKRKAGEEVQEERKEEQDDDGTAPGLKSNETDTHD
ncbi:uncharacterized protein PAC_11359 [Phialocephala subalpina]|uniref:Uncharacterized protein n=1 Tax=Phialocephala subalpina TaxID=576137 RepID=A0A1L7X8W0_9HELO|nr:uncharacterized protein PAC_11359 [Phialocephala subalpina]